jgi:hypothetical protein
MPSFLLLFVRKICRRNATRPLLRVLRISFSCSPRPLKDQSVMNAHAFRGDPTENWNIVDHVQFGKVSHCNGIRHLPSLIRFPRDS